MTHRTEANQPTPIEQATEDILRMLSAAISRCHEVKRVAQRQGVSEPQFRRLLALYFHDKTIADWCRDFGIEDATDPSDKPSHEPGGQGRHER